VRQSRCGTLRSEGFCDRGPVAERHKRPRAALNRQEPAVGRYARRASDRHRLDAVVEFMFRADESQPDWE